MLRPHLFLRLGLPSTFIRHENGAFRKRSSNRRNLKTPGLGFSVDGKHPENSAFWKQWRDDSHVIFLPEYSSILNLKWPVIVAVLSIAAYCGRKTFDAFSECGLGLSFPKDFWPILSNQKTERASRKLWLTDQLAQAHVWSSVGVEVAMFWKKIKERGNEKWKTAYSSSTPTCDRFGERVVVAR